MKRSLKLLLLALVVMQGLSGCGFVNIAKNTARKVPFSAVLLRM